MNNLDVKRVSSVACGRNFVVALGQTLLNRHQQAEATASHAPHLQNESIDSRPERDSQGSARWARTRGPVGNHSSHSPLRSKLKRKSTGHRSTGRLGPARELDRVMGNRHVGGCCGGDRSSKPRPPSSRSPPRTKKRKYAVISPTRKFEKAAAEREEDFTNYRNLVE